MKQAFKISLMALVAIFAFSTTSYAQFGILKKIIGPKNKEYEIRNWQTGQMMKYKNPFVYKPMTATQLNSEDRYFGDEKAKKEIWRQFLAYENYLDNKRGNDDLRKNRKIVAILYCHSNWVVNRNEFDIPTFRFQRLYVISECDEGVTMAERFDVNNTYYASSGFSDTYEFELVKSDGEPMRYLVVDWEHKND